MKEPASIRKRLWQPLGKAIKDFNMIEDGDRIAVGLSGGKDSSLLLFVMSELMKRAPVRFTVVGAAVDMGWPNQDLEPIRRICDRAGVELRVRKSSIAGSVFGGGDVSNPCALCSRLRRGALHNLALESGCNKVALGHHGDDAIATLLMSMIFEGRLATLSPRMILSRKGLVQIRPLIYTREDTVREAVKYYGIETAANLCPSTGHTKRAYAQRLISDIERETPGAGNIMLSALRNVDSSRLWFPGASGRKGLQGGYF